MPMLEIDSLNVSYQRSDAPALRDISLTLAQGERLAVLGESGSGKSTLGLALAGLLPPRTQISGKIVWPGLGTPRPGSDIGFVFQDPAGSLDPLMRIGDQIAEVVNAHSRSSGGNPHRQAIDLLEQVRLPDPPSIARAWPHQLSGGQKQRVAIACAIAASPSLLIADEPTSALDTIVQANILDLLGVLVTMRNMSLILITHDIAVAAANADRIAVLQGGRLIEVGPVGQIIRTPKQDYTRQLMASHIALDAPRCVEGPMA